MVHTEAGMFGMLGQLTHTLTPEEKTILKFLSSNPEATQARMSEATGIKLQKVKRTTADLSFWGYLARIGTSRNGTWKVLVDTKDF